DDTRDLPPARLPEPGPREAPGRARRPGGAARDRHDVARSVPDLPRVRADLDDRGERLRDDGRARVPARARRRHDGARLSRPALRHAVLGRCRDGGGDAALPGADDRVGSRRGRPDGGSVRRARGPPRSDRVRHGRHPGPACYGRGGAEPTVTDANVVLGYINPDYFAGGSITLQPRAAARAIDEKVARPLGLALEDAAWGIHMIVNTNMELATRVVSIER